MAHFRAFWAGILMLAALSLGTQCVAACAAADCAGTPKQHSHCGRHRQPEAPATPAHSVCAYLPAEQPARTAAPVTVPSGFALTPAATPVPALRYGLTVASVDTGPPVPAAPSLLVLKI